MKRTHLFIAVLLSAVILFPPASAEGVSTRRDDKGVWYIEGGESASLYDVFKEMGYAVAEDRLWQMEKYRRAAKGELAEIFGPGDDRGILNQDILARVTGYSSQELEEGFNSLDEETQKVLNGYVAGVNERIKEVSADPRELPFEFHVLGKKLGMETPLIPEPWTPEDILAWESMLLRRFDAGAQEQGQLDNAALYGYLQAAFGQATGTQMFNDLRWINDPDAQTYIPGTGQAAARAEKKSSSVEAGQSKVAENSPVRKEADNAYSGSTCCSKKFRNLWAEQEETLKKLDAYVKMGSYAWVVSGDKTESGRPVIYSGPQMGFSVPAITQEGYINAGGLTVSGMAIPGMPGIVIGRTPHHAWSMQVGHAHTTDYYFETPQDVSLHRVETIKVAGGSNVDFPVYRSDHGPVVSPMPYDPSSYDPAADDPIVAWRYSHWGKEFKTIKAFLEIARAQSMDEFGSALRDVAVCQHFCYADKDGNIAYWMSGMDPVRPDGFDYRLPQGIQGFPQAEWDDDNLKPLSTDRNTQQGFYCGWNNKTNADYPNSFNNMGYFFGPFHRAHVVEEYLKSKDTFSFEEIRNLALNIATTDSLGGGGSPWAFVETAFRTAVQNNPTDKRLSALELMDGYDGHFVAGGQQNWLRGQDRSDAWMLANTWIQEVIDLTFTDELGNSNSGVYRTNVEDNNVYDADADNKDKWKNPQVLFNVILHGLDEPATSLTNSYNWFDSLATPQKVETAEEIIVAGLDSALSKLGDRPWGTGERGKIEFNHDLFNQEPLDLNPLHTIPFASRSTFAHCVRMEEGGPARIESMFALGQSGEILPDSKGEPQFNENFFSMAPVYDNFVYRSFPGFDVGGGHGGSGGCFIKVMQ